MRFNIAQQRRWALGIVAAFVMLTVQGVARAHEPAKLAHRPDVQKQLLNSCALAQWQEALKAAGYTVGLEEGTVVTAKNATTVVTQATLPIYRAKQFIGTLNYAYDAAGRERVFTQEFVLQPNETVLIRTRDGAELGVDTFVSAQGETQSELAVGDGLVRLSDFAPADVDWGCFRSCYGGRWVQQCAWDCFLCAVCGWWLCWDACPRCGHCSVMVGIECTIACWR